MDNKGQFNLNGLLSIVIGLAMLLALLPVIDGLVGGITAGNMTNLAYSSTIILIVGLSGVFAVIMYIMSIFQAQQAPQQQY